jgi:(p)ppGpp synthase/HD superfamily hydrolase
MVTKAIDNRKAHRMRAPGRHCSTLRYAAAMPETAATTPLLTSRFQQAFALASQVHATQVRKGTATPYLAHLMSVAALVLEHDGDEDAAIAALLHDAVEDTTDGAVMAATIRDQFGDHVADIVLACSDAIAAPGQPKAPWRQRKTSYLARLATETDPAVLLVSACDKLHNARTIVADLRTTGPAIWQRFNQHDPAAHLWYYNAMAACYADRVPADLSAELHRVLDQMSTLAATSSTSS